MDRKNRIIRSAYLGILVICWSFLLGRLFHEQYLNSTQQGKYISLSTGLIEIPDDIEWMNIFMDGKKIGFSFYSVQNREAGTLSIQNMMDLSLTVAGVPTEVTTDSRVLVDSLFQLLNFHFTIQSRGYTSTITGIREDQVIIGKMITGTDTARFSLPSPPQIYPSIALKSLLVQQGIQQGDRFTLPVFDPLSQQTIPVNIEHRGKETLPGDSTDKVLNKIKISFNGFPTFLWMDDNGFTWREESMLGLVLEKASPEDIETPSEETHAFDLAEFLAVPVSGDLPDPRHTTSLTMTIEGLSPQQIRQLPLGDFLTSSKPQPTVTIHTQPRANTAPELAPFLETNQLIRSDNPEIRRMAQSLIDSTMVPSDRVRVLVDYVYTSLEKVPVANLVSAVDILNEKRGDCSEHTTLFTALSRTLGIPTKIHIGLVYLEGRFLYHAWSVVYIDGHWIAVDPTFGQVPADATHIPLLEGDFSTINQLTSMIGQIRFTILNSKTRTNL